jgi:glycosyltransferase involved in cell wall biosynthesis
MNIVMVTNTFTPHVGGVARSVEAFTAEYRRRGHRVLVVAPEFPGRPDDEIDVCRVPAIQEFNASDFSVALPLVGLLTDALDAFEPEIIHSHHPFVLGMTALRVARYRNLPLVFTHHTLYEQYTHYVPGDSPSLQRFVIELAVSYCNLSDHVFAPSESIMDLLIRRGVSETPVTVMPTGVDVERFGGGDGSQIRKKLHMPEDAFVVGHLGRLAPEKNLPFLTEAVATFLKRHDTAHFVVVGAGPTEAEMQEIFAREGLAERLHLMGVLENQPLVDALAAMDVFAFASRSETQGMVLTEAMAAGVPVVALDAPGTREVVENWVNGRLLETQSIDGFVAALNWLAELPIGERQAYKGAARATARAYSMSHSADKALTCYARLRSRFEGCRLRNDHIWYHLRDLIEAEWDAIAGLGHAVEAATGDESQIAGPL